MDLLACSLRNFNISNYVEPIEIKSERLGTLFYLLFNERELLNIQMSYNYVNCFGYDEVSRLMSNVVCYAPIEISTSDNNKRKILTNNFYVYAQIFSNALWIIKDNSVTPYFVTISSDSNIEPESLRRNVYYSDSEVRYESNLSFTLKEIGLATEWYDKLENLTTKRKTSSIKSAKGSLVNMSNYIEFNIPSFQRAYYFLDNTRKTDFLPAKITGYITILETFYAVNGDNAHKTAERTAALIGSDTQERITLFKQVKEAYSIRSMYIHGAHINDKNNRKLPEVSNNMDNIARKVFIKMLLHHEELNYTTNNKKINKIFDEMVLSVR